MFGNNAVLYDCLSTLQMAAFVKNTEGRYLAINRIGAKMLGKTREAILGCEDFALFEPAAAEMIVARDQEILRAGKFIGYESTAALLNHTGPTLFQSVKRPLIGPYGAVRGLIGLSLIQRKDPHGLAVDIPELMRELVRSRLPDLLTLCR